VTGSLGADAPSLRRQWTKGRWLGHHAPQFHPSLDRWWGDVDRADRAGGKLHPTGEVRTVFTGWGCTAPLWPVIGGKWAGRASRRPQWGGALCFTAPGAAGDPGRHFYVRSTDNGLTWSARRAVKYRRDNASAMGRFALGQHARQCLRQLVRRAQYQHRCFGTLPAVSSPDNGATWESDMAVSDVIFPKPLQPDFNFQSTYAGNIPP